MPKLGAVIASNHISFILAVITAILLPFLKKGITKCIAPLWRMSKLGTAIFQREGILVRHTRCETPGATTSGRSVATSRGWMMYRVADVAENERTLLLAHSTILSRSASLTNIRAHFFQSWKKMNRGSFSSAKIRSSSKIDEGGKKLPQPAQRKCFVVLHSMHVTMSFLPCIYHHT